MIDDRAVGETERLHPLFLLTGIGGALRGLAGLYAVLGYLAVSGRLGSALFATAVLLFAAAIGLYLYWRRFEYRIGETEIRIDSGIVSRTHRSIPFDRIQDVDIVQGPVARLLGLAQVKFETGASAGSEEGVLHAITLERAQEIREFVRSRRSGRAAQAQLAVDLEAQPLFAMSPRRLLLAGVFNFSLAVFAALFGVTQTVGDVIGFDPFSRSFWRSIVSASDPITLYLLQHQLLIGIAGVLSLVVIGVGTGIVRTSLRDYGFRLDRAATGLRRRRGLLTRTDVTLPLARAQAVLVETGPIRERLRWRELRLQSLARDEGGNGDHVLAPLARDQEIEDILTALGWQPLPTPIDWMRVARAYLWIFVIGVSPLLLIFGLQLAAIGMLAETTQSPMAPNVSAAIVPLLLVLVLVGALVLARLLAWRRTGYALDGDRLIVRTGWWRRRILILPVRKIQSMDLAQSFVSRWFGIASLTFGIAGGSAVRVNSIPALPEKIARELRDQLLSKLT